MFVGAIPALYDRYLASLMFEPFAADLAQRLRILAPARVLEIAAGTGIATRAICQALPPGATIVATDLNQPMLDYAAAHTSAAMVSWRQADAHALPFADQSFDAVACQFGVMFFADKATALGEALRVLKPGGRLIVSVWAQLAENPIAEVMDKAVGQLFPDTPLRFMAAPFGYQDAARIRADLRAAGFGAIEIDTVDKQGTTASARDAAIGFCQGTPLRTEIQARDPALLEAATALAQRAIEDRFGAGPITAALRALVISARRPTPA